MIDRDQGLHTSNDNLNMIDKTKLIGSITKIDRMAQVE